MSIGWIVQYDYSNPLSSYYDERILTALKLKYPHVSVEVIQIPRATSALSGPTFIDNVILLFEQSVVSLKNKHIRHIIVPAQSSLLSRFISGASPLDGQSINIRHIGINFYNNNSATPDVFNAQTMLRFIDTDDSLKSSIYGYMSGTAPVALFIYEVGSGGEIQKNDLVALAPLGTTIIQIPLNFSGSSYTPSDVTNANNAYYALPASSVSIVVHCPDGTHATQYQTTFNLTILQPNLLAVHVGGNFRPQTTPLACDLYYGLSVYEPTPLQLNFPGFVITDPMLPNVEWAVTYYEILQYIASNATYRGAFGTLKFANRTKVSYWIADRVIHAGSLAEQVDNLQINPRWITA